VLCLLGDVKGIGSRAEAGLVTHTQGKPKPKNSYKDKFSSSCDNLQHYHDYA